MLQGPILLANIETGVAPFRFAGVAHSYLLAAADDAVIGTPSTSVHPIIWFFSDPIIVTIMFLALVLLLVLLAIRLGYYQRMARTSTTLARTVGDLVGAPIPEKKQAIPAVVELAPRTPLPTGGRPGAPRGNSAASETVDIPPRKAAADFTPSTGPTSKEIKEIEKTDLGRAALLWQKISCWEQAADCYFKLGNPLRSANIWLALDQSERALPMLRDALKQEPENGDVRLRLVETLLDLGKDEEAKGLIQSGPQISDQAGAKEIGAYYESLGRDYEAKHDHDSAIRFYEMAIGQFSEKETLKNRVQFLTRMKTLSAEPIVNEDVTSPSGQLLAKYVKDSNKNSHTKTDAKETKELSGHEIIVGHLAMGFQQFEPPRSIRSVFSLSRRFELEKLLGESSRGMVFLANDDLLDFNVALRILRLPDHFGKMEILKERLRAIAQLNHPNLAKITFADREGLIIRVATEYLPGGDLRDFLTKLGGVGLPLIIRMSMHLASALHTAHVRGIPHGDVRPENLIIGPDQRIKLLDFAIIPIPVATFDLSTLNVNENTDTPRPFDFAAHNEGVQSDLLQFADVLDFMMQHARRTVDPVASGVNDTTSELTALVAKIRSGGYTTILKLWQKLEEIFDRTLPSQSSGEKPRNV